MKNILVTGVRSVIGQGIVKSLKEYKVNIYGCEYFPYTPVEKYLKKNFLLPDIFKKKNLNIWKNQILKIIKFNKIHLLIPGTDFELNYFSNYQKFFEKNSNCKVLVSDKKVINIANNKWQSYNFFKKNNFSTPKTFLNLNQIKKKKYPLIIKPKIGNGSKNIFLANNFEELKFFSNYVKNSIIQEFVKKNYDEYTAGGFYKNNNIKSLIILKKKIKKGNTIKADIFSDEFVKNELEKMIKILKPNGPINIQFFYSKINKKIFFIEINPRFSGTTYFRTLLGYNELGNLLNKKPINKLNNEYSVIRYHDEKKIKK